MTNERKKTPRTIFGTVVSDKMDKTITVRHDRVVKHPLYGKYIRRSTRYKAHDERNEAREGDKVEIVHGRPLSRSKHFRLLKIVRRARNTTASQAASSAPASGEGAPA